VREEEKKQDGQTGPHGEQLHDRVLDGHATTSTNALLPSFKYCIVVVFMAERTGLEPDHNADTRETRGDSFGLKSHQLHRALDPALGLGR